MQRAVAIELGPYQLGERIGEGGSGQVFRATGPDGTVAVKMLASAGELDDAARARFKREIVALGQLQHPNLVRMLDHGIDPELGPYLVLPMLAGTNLRALCGRALCPEAALLLIQPIVHATAALHAAGFVHRDLKPENAIAAPDGTITVIDLGLAWRDGMTHHTDTGAAVGSVGYMAPEQIEGRHVDGAADVWALGVILYELVTGKRPFARPRPAEEAAAALIGTYPRLTAADRRASEELAKLVAHCLAIDPARRPTIQELASAIDYVIDWTTAVADERAAVVADPAGYQARITAFRVGRIERHARELVDAGKPFEALTACDRGLAYAPEHPGLLAIVGIAEAFTSRRKWNSSPAAGSPTAAASSPAASSPLASPAAASSPASSQAAVASPSSPNADTSSQQAAASATPSRPVPRKWLWGAGAALVAIVVGGIAVRMLASDPDSPDVPSSSAADPWADHTLVTTPPAKPTGPTEEDKAIVKDFVSIFGRAMASSEQHEATKSKAPTEEDKAMMRDMLSLFGRVLEHPNAKSSSK